MFVSVLNGLNLLMSVLNGLSWLILIVTLLRERGKPEDPRFAGDKLIYRS
jgi:hypothetical protein